MTCTAEFICLLNRSSFESVLWSRASALVPHVEWESFYKLCEFNAVTALAHRNLEMLRELYPGVLIPPWPENMKKDVLQISKQGNLRQYWLCKILSLASEAGIKVVILKGSLLAATLYKDPAYKKMNDVDLLVKWEDAERFAAHLENAGFQGVGPLIGKAKFSSKSHHAPPYVSSDLGCVVGIHWGLCSPFTQWTPKIEAIWEAAIPVTIWGEKGLRMGWEENLLHLCTHLPFFKTGLRELADVYNICLDPEVSIDWERFDRLVEEWNAHEAAFRILTLAKTLQNFELPEKMRLRWLEKSSAKIKSDTSIRSRSAEHLLTLRSTHVAAIEKNFAIFRLSQNYAEQMKAWSETWKLTLWPPSSELKRLNGKTSKQLGLVKQRILAPKLCLQALMQDHGAIPIVAITAENIIRVIKTTLALGFLRSGPSLNESHLGRILKVLE